MLVINLFTTSFTSILSPLNYRDSFLELHVAGKDNTETKVLILVGNSEHVAPV